jgi:aminoglycoside phosphotransferase (APT) family kinase protein
MPMIPTRPEHITAEWLTEFLAPQRPDVLITSIEVLASTQGAATRLRVKPTYAAGRDAGLPPLLFIKTALTSRMLVADPHMYVTEVKFYEEIRPTVGCETPAVFAWSLDDETSRFAVVIEDLSVRGAVFPSALSGLTAEDVAPLVRNLARLHAPNWGRSDLEGSYPWLETSTRGRSTAWWREGAPDVAAYELRTEPYKLEAIGADRHPIDRVVAAVARLQVDNDVAPRTVTHGDTHIGNCYLLPGNGGGLLDWQLMRIGNWGNDVGYTIVTALDVEERRRGEQDLLRLYLDELRGLGVDPPGWDAAWAHYRKQMVWGIIAWVVTPTAMYDASLLGALISRGATAVDDLDTFALLGV